MTRTREDFTRASQGDPDAVEALLARYLPDLRAYVDRHAGDLVRRRESASDLAQSVCREALESLRGGRFEYRGEGPFRQWLYRAAVMKLMNRHRHWNAARRDAGREVAELDAGPEERAALEPAHRATPSADAAWVEELEGFRRAFAGLAENHQEVLTLHHVEGLTHAEIAERTGISEGASRMQLSRALGRLAMRLDPGG